MKAKNPENVMQYKRLKIKTKHKKYKYKFGENNA